MSAPYPEYAAKQYPPGKEPDRRRIDKCSDPKAWYANMVGQTVTIHYFATFGAWDIEGRWVDYYDLSAPLDEPIPVKQKVTSLFNKLFK
jgi:hypothetical protein